MADGRVYYNEIDRNAAAWLRELIRAGHLPAGDVDERSITDVVPTDLHGYRQCHFFAGIGGWPLALMLAGWPAERSVWTGSCPCQPFSVAGKQRGTADERHLWPEFARLIGECRPATVFGEQVASPAGRQWFAGVRADLEALEYAAGAGDVCAAGVAAPHIRQRIYWVADAMPARWTEGRASAGRGQVTGSGGADRLVLTDHDGRASRRTASEAARHGCSADSTGRAGGMGDTERPRLEGHAGHGDHGNQPGRLDSFAARPASASGRASAWGEFDIAYLTDGTARRIEPGTQQMVDGLSVALERLRTIEEFAWDEVRGHADASDRDPDEILRMVRDRVHAKAGGAESSDGVREQLHAPTLLLDFLFCIEAARHGATERCGFQKAGHEVRCRIVRGVRAHGAIGGPPCKRRSDGQLGAQPANAVLALSFVLARHAEAYRQEARKAHAADGRVVRLRGYGNAIVPQVAAEFIGAYLDGRAA